MDVSTLDAPVAMHGGHGLRADAETPRPRAFPGMHLTGPAISDIGCGATRAGFYTMVALVVRVNRTNRFFPLQEAVAEYLQTLLRLSSYTCM